MASITKFEDLIAWQEARALVKIVYQLASNGSLAKDFGMKDQIQRASVAVMTNIAKDLIVSQLRSLLGSSVLPAVQPLKFSPCCMLHWT